VCASVVTTDDLARGIDAGRLGAEGGRGIVEGGVGAAIGVVEETVAAAGVVRPGNIRRPGPRG